MMWYVSELECLQECVCINISERESLCVNVQKTKSLCGLMCEGERKRGGEREREKGRESTTERESLNPLQERARLKSHRLVCGPNPPDRMSASAKQERSVCVLLPTKEQLDITVGVECPLQHHKPTSMAQSFI